jgi:hypothetical protein
MHNGPIILIKIHLFSLIELKLCVNEIPNKITDFYEPELTQFKTETNQT